MRAALYARFSTDQQSQASIPDQFAACERLALREGLTVVARFSDAAISGASIANRPGFLDMMRAAERGAFDVVIAEALDRLSRSQADTAVLFDDLRFMRVGVRTISEGVVSEMHVGLMGTMNAMALGETGRKTRRGLAGRVAEGLSGGGRSYGYAVSRRFDADGARIAGLRSIDPAEAAIVRRIFAEYAAGLSPRAIVQRLNAEGVPSPRGGTWNASTINGNAGRGNGVLHNQLYRGVIVWGRQAWAKDRRSGKRRARAGDPGEILRRDAPELRIVSDEAWAAVQARHAAMTHVQGPRAANAARRPVRLLSGLLRCGHCAGALVVIGAKGRIGCSTFREKGSAVCDNGATALSAEVERRVLAALRGNLLRPELVEEYVREFHTEATRRSKQKQGDRGRLERELAEAGRRAARLVDQVVEGELSGPAVKARLEFLERRRGEIEAELGAMAAPDVVRLHPGAAAEYRRQFEALQTVLGAGDEDMVERETARTAFRALVQRVRVTWTAVRGVYHVEMEGDLAPILQRTSASYANGGCGDRI